MITGAHLVLFSTQPDADRDFLRGVTAWPSVGASGPDDPWLIFGLPPAELAVHPTDIASSVAPSIALYLMCDDLTTTVEALRERGVEFRGEPRAQSWGTITSFLLPSGAEVGLYQPRHATPHHG